MPGHTRLRSSSFVTSDPSASRKGRRNHPEHKPNLYAGLTARRLFRCEVQLVGHPGQLRQGSRLHLSHDLAAMHFYSDLADADVEGDLLVEAASHHQRHHLTLAGGVLRFVPLRDQGERVVEWYATSTDIEDLKRAEEELRRREARLRDAQMQLAHANRVTATGQLAASIAHEVSQPIAAALTNANAARRWLGAEPPDLEEVRQALGRIIRDGRRASDIIGRIRALVRKAPPRNDQLDINGTMLEVIALTRSELRRNGTSLQTQLADGLPLVLGDRIQLQQVTLNLILNAVEAMSGSSEPARELLIRTELDGSGSVLVAVQDSGPGLQPESLDRLFDAFYTTKPHGMGMGLSICRSIIEAHGGRMWATANTPR